MVLVLAVTAFLVNLRPAAEEAGITGAFDTYVEVTDDLAVNLPAAERAGCAWPVRWHSPHKPWSRHTSKRHLAYNDSPNPALSVPRLLPLLQSLISRR